MQLRSVRDYFMTCIVYEYDGELTGTDILKFAFIVRQSMTSCRRLQPIPHDFEHALKRMHLRCDDLIPHVRQSIPPSAEYIPTLLPSPPPEDEETVGTLPSLPFLGPHLSGEGDRMRSAYIPKHFPAFPSRHTYRHTPVFTERERDPRKIRERATEDGRHGEEALRKLARAASKDQQLAAGGRDKKPWGRRMESMDSMFERTVKGLAKKMQKSAEAAMEASAGVAPSAASDAAAVRVKSTLNLELGPIVNCERDLWRRTTASTSRNVVDKGVERKNVAALTRLNSWVSTQ